MTATVTMRERRSAGGDSFYEADGTVYTMPAAQAAQYVEKGWATYVTRPAFPPVPAYSQAMRWAELPVASPANAGMQVWCTDYPSVGGSGALIMSNGVRWKAVSQQHCLLSPPSSVAGVLFDTGSGNALYGNSVAVPSGVIMPDDNIRIIYIATTNSGGTVFRAAGLRAALTSAGITSGAIVNRFGTSSTTTNQWSVERVASVLDNTTIRQAQYGQPGAIVSTIAHNVTTLSGAGFAELQHLGVVVEPSSDTSITMHSCTVYLEYGR